MVKVKLLHFLFTAKYDKENGTITMLFTKHYECKIYILELIITQIIKALKETHLLHITV